MKHRKAVYAASLDPITYGHLNIIERAAPLYDSLVVLVAVDSRKNYTFTQTERLAMAKEAVSHISNVTVDVCVGEYVVRKAHEYEAHVIIRGLRNVSDMEAEQTLAEENRHIAPGIETIWIPCLPRLMHISSSLVKSHVGADPEWEEHVARLTTVSVTKKLKEKHFAERAKKHWLTLMNEVGRPAASDEILKDLLSCYGQPHRAYHNLAHIVSMLDKFEHIDTTGLNVTAVRLAVWFHDVIYDPKAKMNEEFSAKYAQEALTKLQVSDEVGRSVADLVLQTKHDQEPSGANGETLTDLDLAILGAPWREFRRYEKQIREEYAHVSDEDFKKGRVQVLDRFTARHTIYATDEFKKMYERQARQNLARSIKILTEA